MLRALGRTRRCGLDIRAGSKAPAMSDDRGRFVMSAAHHRARAAYLRKMAARTSDPQVEQLARPHETCAMMIEPRLVQQVVSPPLADD
jgi:hypothetical protein